MEYFNATKLIPVDYKGRKCKKVSHFLDNKYIKAQIGKNIPKASRGRGSSTMLPRSLLKEYLLWLTPLTRKAVLNGVDIDEIINNIEKYWN